jgi:hypothetical protein
MLASTTFRKFTIKAISGSWTIPKVPVVGGTQWL